MDNWVLVGQCIGLALILCVVWAVTSAAVTIVEMTNKDEGCD